MKNLAITFLFKEIFPTKNDWAEFIQAYTAIDYSEDNSFIDYLYTKFYRYYGNANVNYETKEEFKCYFSIGFEDYYYKYKTQYNQIKKLYAITDDEILKVGEAIRNEADNPNDKPDDPTKPLEYITRQDYTVDKGSKFYKFNDYINKLTDLRTRKFLDTFATYFKWVYTNKKYIY